MTVSLSDSINLKGEVLDGFGLAVLNSIWDPVGVFGTDFSIKYVNKSMAYIHKCKPEEMIGKNCYSDFCKGGSNPCGQCPIIHVRDAGKPYITERWLDFPDGKRRWGEVRSYPMRDNEKKVVAVIVVVMETTALLEKLKKKQEYADFLSEKLNRNAGKSTKIKTGREDINLTVNFTERETEVLRLLTEGYTNTVISDILTISRNTVKRHVDNIFNKLGVSDRTQAAVIAVRNRLL